MEPDRKRVKPSRSDRSSVSAWTANLKHELHRLPVGLVRTFLYWPVAYRQPRWAVHIAELMQSTSVAGMRALLESVFTIQNVLSFYLLV